MKSTFDRLKEHQGKKYAGMKTGQSHDWTYTEPEVHETKTEPDRWNFEMRSIKQRKQPAPKGSGARVGTEYHWLHIAHQVVKKIDQDRYETLWQGHKYKIGHKRPYWQTPSYDYKEQKNMTQTTLEALNREIKELSKK